MNNEQSVIEGTTLECLRHFSRTRRLHKKEGKQMRDGIGDLLGIGKGATNLWFIHNKTPIGTNLLKLQYFLELIGYTIKEWVGFPDPLKSLVVQHALSLVSVEDIQIQVNATSDAIRRWLTRTRIPSVEHAGSVSSLVELHKEAAAAKTQEWIAKIEELDLKGVVTATTSGPEPIAVSSQVTIPHQQNGSTEHEQAIETLGHLILAVKPLATRILSEEFSPEERQRLREKTTLGRSNGVFDLSNLLNRLCGERARKEIK